MDPNDGLPFTGISARLLCWQDRLRAARKASFSAEGRAAFVGAILALSSGLLPSAEAPLLAGRAVESDISFPRVHSYQVSLANREILVLDVLVSRGDVTLSWFPPGGSPPVTVTTEESLARRERLYLYSGRSGTHRLTISPATKGFSKHYKLRVVSRRPVDPRDRLRVEAARSIAEARAWARASPVRAEASARRGLALWQSLQDPAEEARARLVLGEILFDSDRQIQAIEELHEAIKRCRAAGEQKQEGWIQRQLGDYWWRLLHTRQALESFSRARELFEVEKDLASIAQTLTDMGSLYHYQGDIERAGSLYNQALGLRKKVGDREAMFRGLQNLGAISVSLNQPLEALRYFEKARSYLPSVDRDVPALLREEGRAYFRLEDFEEAEKHYSRVIEICRVKADCRSWLPSTLNLLGNLHKRQGRFQEASRCYDEAEQISRDLNDLASLADVYGNRGHVAMLQGQPAEAARWFRSAWEIYGKLDWKIPQATLLLYLAQADLALGKVEQALERLRSSRKLLEELRVKTREPTLRALSFASLHTLYESFAATLLNLYRQTQDERHAIEALEFAESSRARTLLDQLMSSARDREVEKDHGLLENAEASQVSEIQASLDDNTVLLSYLLTEERSLLWLVRRKSILAFDLPARDVIEDRAKAVYSRWKEKRPGEREAHELSRVVLEPVIHELRGERILVVSDGYLQAIHLGALPDPRSAAGEPLLLRNEVLYLPSASFLVHLRRTMAGRRSPPPPKLLAIFADPVFGAEDERLAHLGMASPGEVPEAPSRLPKTRIEADQILQAVGGASSKVLLAQDFDANRDAVLDPGLSQYRILHFATHGVLSLENPERSGLELSRWGVSGKPLPGTLFAHQIYHLHLPADLVVLSACETGLGKLLPGEGALALPRAFFNAGAQRVVVSLWRVQDDSTSNLMGHFYRAMFQGGRSPADALRQAQIQLYRSKEYSMPYYWAGFVLQGNWP